MTKLSLLFACALASTTMASCTLITEYKGELDCGASGDLEAWLLLEQTVGIPDPEGWFGFAFTPEASGAWITAPLENTSLEPDELKFEVDFDLGDNVQLDALLEPDDRGGWQGDVDFDTDITCDRLRLEPDNG